MAEIWYAVTCNKAGRCLQFHATRFPMKSGDAVTNRPGYYFGVGLSVSGPVPWVVSFWQENCPTLAHQLKARRVPRPKRTACHRLLQQLRAWRSCLHGN